MKLFTKIGKFNNNFSKTLLVGVVVLAAAFAIRQANSFDLYSGAATPRCGGGSVRICMGKPLGKLVLSGKYECVQDGSKEDATGRPVCITKRVKSSSGSGERCSSTVQTDSICRGKLVGQSVRQGTQTCEKTGAKDNQGLPICSAEYSDSSSDGKTSCSDLNSDECVSSGEYLKGSAYCADTYSWSKCCPKRQAYITGDNICYPKCPSDTSACKSVKTEGNYKCVFIDSLSGREYLWC